MNALPQTQRSGISQKFRLSVRHSSFLLAFIVSLLAYSPTASHAQKQETASTTKKALPEFPESLGLETFKIRFIRLDHGGQGWDDGMRQTQADTNFLQYFGKAIGVHQIARKGESHRIGLLDKYPRDGFPPFVYFTGNHNIGKISQKDLKILREYCLGGGLLIADAGSKSFHNSFVHLSRQIFPDKTLLKIPADDPLFQSPYSFPDGPPAFWAHGGKEPLGIKHDGRWMVFYHPGDMNDAWKSDNYTDVTPEMREKAMKLGVNLVMYSFEQWNNALLGNDE